MAAKGFAFERKMCKRWSMWFSDDEDDSIFWRTDGSGGRARSKASRILTHDFGDMKFTKIEGKPLIDRFLFEFKKGYGKVAKLKQKKIQDIINGYGTNPKKVYKKIRAYLSKQSQSSVLGILDYIDGKGKGEHKLVEWWRLAEIDRKLAGRAETIVVFERDGKHACAAISLKLFLYLTASGERGKEPWPHPRAQITFVYEGTNGLERQSVVIIRLEELFKYSPEELMQAAGDGQPKIERIS